MRRIPSLVLRVLTVFQLPLWRATSWTETCVSMTRRWGLTLGVIALFFAVTPFLFAQQTSLPSPSRPALPYANLNFGSLVAIYLANVVIAWIYASRRNTENQTAGSAHLFWTASWWALLLSYKLLDLWGTGPATTLHDVVSILLLGVYFSYARKLMNYSFAAALIFSFLVVWTQTLQRAWSSQTQLRELVAYGPSMLLSVAAFAALAWTFHKFFRGYASVVGTIAAGTYAFLQLLLFYFFALGATDQWPAALWLVVVSVRVALALCFCPLILKELGIELPRVERISAIVAGLIELLSIVYGLWPRN